MSIMAFRGRTADRLELPLLACLPENGARPADHAARRVRPQRRHGCRVCGRRSVDAGGGRGETSDGCALHRLPASIGGRRASAVRRVGGSGRRCRDGRRGSVMLVLAGLGQPGSAPVGGTCPAVRPRRPVPAAARNRAGTASSPRQRCNDLPTPGLTGPAAKRHPDKLSGPEGAHSMEWHPLADQSNGTFWAGFGLLFQCLLLRRRSVLQ
jgi:hypothetical protein